MNVKTKILPAVAAAIFNDKGEVLLQKRKDVNRWCIISGHVEFGENIKSAMLREIIEETNVDGELLRFVGVYSSPESQTYYYTKETIQYVTSYFVARLRREIEPSFSNNETSELRYFPVDALPGEMATINPEWLKDALNDTGEVFIR